MNQEPYRPDDYNVPESLRNENMGSAQPQKKEKRARFWPRAIALGLVCVLLGGAAGFGGSLLYDMGKNLFNRNSSNSTNIYESNREPTIVEVTHTNTGKELSLEEVYASWVNSTVGISTEIVTTNWFGQTVNAAAGSGFVISADGYIVTNYHVVEGARSIKVTFYDGAEYTATLVGGEPNNDVAVLKINAQGLTPVILGNSDYLHVGQTVSAIGNPLGELTFSQTAGVVSAKDRTVTLSDGTRMNMIQTDCTINSGNSGGPLFNLYGEVIGITSAKYSNNGNAAQATIEGIGFAIPMNDVVGIIKDLMAHGYVTGKPSVGILLDDVDKAAQRYGIPAGAEVLAILDGSCAQVGGLQVGDIVTAVENDKVASTVELQSAVGSHRAGDKVTFTVYRNGETVQVQLILDESNQERSAAMDKMNQEYAAAQQQQQQNQQQSQERPSFDGFDFDFGFPFGW